MPHSGHTTHPFGGKDSANRENNKIKTIFFYFSAEMQPILSKVSK